MKNMIFILVSLTVSGFAMAQGVLNGNILDKNGKPFPKKEVVDEEKKRPTHLERKTLFPENKVKESPSKSVKTEAPVIETPVKDTFLDGVYEKEEHRVITKDNFTQPSVYKELTFYGCEVFINKYLFDIQSITRVKFNNNDVDIYSDGYIYSPSIKANEQAKFRDEYLLRRSICSFRQTFN